MEEKIIPIVDRTVNVRYRAAGFGAYKLNDGRVRQFDHNEVKRDIPVRELEELSYSDSGFNFMQHNLLINDQEVCEYLGLTIEPEYFYTEETIKTLLQTGTEDQLLDCIDFAPKGVLSMIRDVAVQIRLNDVNKRQIILEKLGYNVTAAIANLDYANSDTPVTDNSGAKRRAAVIEAENQEGNGRKSQPLPTYNRVN